MYILNSCSLNRPRSFLMILRGETWRLLKYITTCLCPFPWISYAHFSRGIKLEAKSAHRSTLPMKVDLYSNVYHKFIRKTSDRVVRELARFLRRCTIPHYLSIYGDLRNMMYSSLDARLIHLYIISRNKYASFFCILSPYYVLIACLARE